MTVALFPRTGSSLEIMRRSQTAATKMTVAAWCVVADNEIATHGTSVYQAIILMKSWYYAVNEQQQGPVTGGDILQMQAVGTLTPESLVWCGELSDWTPLGSVPRNLLSPEEPTPAVAPMFAPAMAGVGVPTEYRLEFQGKAGEYFRIWIVNVVLSVVTLGIYAAWAKVRTRRYFYGNTLLDGKPFDFTGNPIAILKGNLVFGGLFILYTVTASLFPPMAVLVMLVVFVLMPWLIQKALRFRAHHTVHRNVRFQFHGAVGEAYTVYLGLALLTPFTLGLLMPYMHFRQKQYSLGNMAWGDARADMRCDSNIFYMTALKCLGLLVLGGMICGFAVALIGSALSGGASIGGQEVAAISTVITIYLGFFLIAIYYRVRTTNHVINSTVWKGVGSLHSSVRTRDLIWLYITNGLAVVASLGLLIPWVLVRMARYRTSKTVLHARDGSLNSVAQASGASESAMGDSGADIFDFEIGF